MHKKQQVPNKYKQSIVIRLCLEEAKYCDLTTQLAKLFQADTHRLKEIILN